MTTLRYKMIDGVYNPETRESKVIIATRFGNFTGSAKTAIEHPSAFLGCQIAENRALIKAYTWYAKKCKEDAKALRRFFLEIMETRSFNEKAYQVKMLKNRIGWYDKESYNAKMVALGLSNQNEALVREWEDAQNKYDKVAVSNEKDS